MKMATGLVVAIMSLSGCTAVDMMTTGSAVLLNESAQYEPTLEVELLGEPPARKYREIAIVEARGSHAAGTPNMLERLRIEARKIGAHAVIPATSERQQTPQGAIYNPFLGGYQTIGGVQTDIVRGVAIRYD